MRDAPEVRILHPMNRTEIDRLHGRLLDLHKLLLDAVRADYEREHGTIANAGALLQLVINHERFAWLRPLSGILVEIDDPDVTPDAASARAKVERLFSDATPGFHSKYLDVLQSLPAAAEAHAVTMAALRALPLPASSYN